MAYPQYQPAEHNPSLEEIFGVDDKIERGINGFEIIIVILGLFAIILTTWMGYNNQSTINRDKQRSQDINQVLSAINLFYLNSSTIPSNRKYPSSGCSSRSNEVDYEFSLRQQLTGQRRNVENHAYIKLQDFPLDPWGIYSINKNQRQISLRSCSSPQIYTENSQEVYADAHPSCNFRSSDERFRKCYLYTSNIAQDQFELAYYSETKKGFITFTRTNDNPVREGFVPA